MTSLIRLILAAAVVSTVTAAPATTLIDTDAPDFEIGSRDVLAARQSPNYNQDYTTGNTVSYTAASDGYSVSFTGASDFVVGKGWSKGTNRSITFSGSTTASSGTVLLAVYGWSKNPLIEYYVQEYSNGAGAAQGEKVGSYTSDGSTYEIWKHQQVNQPSIVSSSSTFWQYISVRQNQRTSSGTVTVANHFAAWAKNGLDLGTLDYQVMATEGWNKATGSSHYTLSSS
ncbi:beta-xylanase 1 [Grosmannia clavigera kw1407]|uniref:Endo-1,4-beta-xylanase n=1 Tax=Grosmannia clavigera (strain kw1407 / UAMH 11150) TaxID=655863 RepID=F0XC21_GROCL|nr:beta-xylanase 1 [Grosmannia clavigera kw1407]EFX03450.1 beta-xylanase 1 [Grosmannia clavigera kw1407]